MPTKDNTEELIGITYKFYENLYALRIFDEQIGQLAEEYDESTKGKFFTGLADLAGISKDTIDTTGGTPFEMHFKHKISKPDLSLLEAPKTDETSPVEIVEQPVVENLDVASSEKESNENLAQAKNIIEVEFKDEQHFFQVMKFLRSSRKYTARQSKLLRQGALISLISYFESLEIDLLQFFYLAYPAALPSDGKLLSLADLREIGSIDEAEKLLITKEVDTLLRDTTEAQIEYFTKRPKVDLKCLNPYIDNLLEVIQRRNLFVHNNGIVNKIYLSKLSNEYLKQNNIKDGDELEIDGEYLSKAIDTICVCGTMLIQQSWRKWDEKSAEVADTVLREYTYDLLIEKRWNLIDKLADYAASLHFVSDSDARITIINQAIALKEQNKIGEMESLLSKKDWSSCALKFHVALYSLKEQYDKMIPLLTKAIAAGEIDKEAIDEWPLFRWFRESEHYQPVICKLFSQ
jgi:hypothetical protein